MLIPSNPAYEPMFYSNEDGDILPPPKEAGVCHIIHNFARNIIYNLRNLLIKTKQVIYQNKRDVLVLSCCAFPPILSAR